MLDDKARRFRYEKWWWAANVPAVVGLYFLLPSVWENISILYLALVSIYALVLTASGGEQAAEAASAASED